jgi:diaminohydroxyphosphoribosylaminopyrimidine deaminase/5-amino-6-(5-phosphoribosylamino)uracil reductase
LATSREHPAKKAALLRKRGVELWELPLRKGHISLRALLRRFGDRGCTHILVEGGAGIFGSFLEEGLADEVLLFLAPKLIGRGGISWSGNMQLRKIAKARPLPMSQVERIGEDLLIRSRNGS